jgi:hypothetical protein
MTSLHELDIVIPFHPKDTPSVLKCIRSCKQHVEGCRNIYLISKDDPHVDGAKWVPEESFPFKFDDIKAMLEGGRGDRYGWYLQQLLKLYADTVIDGLSEHYLVVDSDVVFKNRVQFITADGTPCYAYGREYYAPYFAHIARILPDVHKVFPDRSGICHHMIFTRRILEEIRGRLGGADAAWKTIIGAIDKNELSGFSEYELYFNYMLIYHSSQMQIRPLSWTDARYESDNDNRYHYVAYHSWMRSGA